MMVAAAILKNKKSRYLKNRLINFNKKDSVMHLDPTDHIC